MPHVVRFPLHIAKLKLAMVVSKESRLTTLTFGEMLKNAHDINNNRLFNIIYLLKSS